MPRDDFRRLWLSNIYQQYAEDVFNVIRFRLRPLGLGDAADDLLQEVFLTAIDKFDSLISHPDIRRWLFATANFKAKNYMRKMASERRRILWDIDATGFGQKPDPSAENALARILEEQIDCTDVLRRIKESISDADKILYEQSYEKEVPPAELSSLYGITEAAVRMRISRMRKRILFVVKNLLYNALQFVLTHIL